MKKILLLALGLNSYAMAISQAGTPVTTFGASGQASLSANYTKDMAIQPNGKIVVLGQPNITPGNDDLGVARINADGTLDNTFGSGGYSPTAGFNNDDRAGKLALQADGSIVVVGETRTGGTIEMVLVRYLSTGGLDNSLGSGGKLSLGLATWGSGAAVAVQPDGKIVVAGGLINNNCVVARLNADGSWDNSFGASGKKEFKAGDGTRNISTIKILPDGKIVLAGTAIGVAGDFMVARLLPDGTLDTSLNGSGIAMADIGGQDDELKSLAIDENGNYLLSGYVYNMSGDYYGWGVARFTNSGALDNGFADHGRLVPSIDGSANAVAVQSDGKILVAGHITSINYTPLMYINRYNSNGTPDLDFDGDGTLTGGYSSSTISTLTLWGGRIYALGSFDGAAVLAFQNDVILLPLTFTSFAASHENAIVKLQWQTAMEKNTSQFEVERSVDGKQFAPIAKVPATGNSARLITYMYADLHPARPVSQYRLKMVDKDGKVSYSKVVVVKTGGVDRSLTVFPNPVSTHLQLQTLLQGHLRICLYDSKGQLVKEQEAIGIGTPLTVNVTGLQKGIYQVVVTGMGKREVSSIVKE